MSRFLVASLVSSALIAAGCRGSTHTSGGGGQGGSGAGGSGGGGDPVHPITPATICGQPAALPDGVVLDAGHQRAIDVVVRSKTRVLSVDSGAAYPQPGANARRRWILWDAATATQVASGIADTIPLGSTSALFVIKANGQVEIRSMENGQLQGTIDASSADGFGLAADGSYVWGASSTALSAWTVTGTPIFSRPGSYAGFPLFAAADAIRVVGGPAGAGVVELIAAKDGSQSGTFPFKGQFRGWFLDGSHFTTYQDSYTRVYDQSGTQVVVGLEQVDGGFGELAWRARAGIFRLPDLTTPVLAINDLDDGHLVVANGHVLALPRGPEIRIVHLDASPLQIEVSHTPVVAIAPWLFGLDENGNWAAGGAGGLYLRGTESDPLAAAHLGCGQIADLAATPAGQVMAAIGDRVHVIDAVSGTYQKSLPIAAGKLAVMDDGNTLVAQNGFSLQVVRTSDGATLHTFDGNSDINPGLGAVLYGGWSLATSKGLLARTKVNSRFGWTSLGRQLTDLTGTTVLLSDQQLAQLLLSPSGRRVEVPLADPQAGPCAARGTRFFDENGQFTDSTTLTAIGWLGDDKVLAQDSCNGALDTRIYDAVGTPLGTATLPALDAVQPVSDTLVYAPSKNVIYDLTSGAVAWSSPLPFDGLGTPVDAHAHAGTIAGPKVVFASDGRLYVQSYR